MRPGHYLLALALLLAPAAACEECIIEPQPGDGSADDATLGECITEGQPWGEDAECCPGHRCADLVCRIDP